jgi:hypothetical protein
VHHAANMCAYVSLQPTGYYPNKKLNPTRHQMCRTYAVTTTLRDGGPVIQDEIIYEASGAGRNCFFFKDSPLVLKEYLVSEKHTTHANEMKIFNERPDLRPFMPEVYAHLQTEAPCNAWYNQVLDVLIVEKAGPSVKWLLESGFKDHDQAGRHFKPQTIPIDYGHKSALQIIRNPIGEKKCVY